MLAGLALASTHWVCVMDGDLQHPPEYVPALLEAAMSQPADLVVGSRYIAGGGRDEGLGAVRTAVSWGSTLLAKVVFPRRLSGIHDPMSGFFLFRRAALAQAMMPRGFKILLEIAVRHPDLVKCEVPFVFVEREFGDSKGTLKEGFRYLRLLVEMRWSLSLQHVAVTRPRAGRQPLVLLETKTATKTPEPAPGATREPHRVRERGPNDAGLATVS